MYKCKCPNKRPPSINEGVLGWLRPTISDLMPNLVARGRAEVLDVRFVYVSPHEHLVSTEVARHINQHAFFQKLLSYDFFLLRRHLSLSRHWRPPSLWLLQAVITLGSQWVVGQNLFTTSTNEGASRERIC